jgi:hypothetical protein
VNGACIVAQRTQAMLLHWVSTGVDWAVDRGDDWGVDPCSQAFVRNFNGVGTQAEHFWLRFFLCQANVVPTALPESQAGNVSAKLDMFLAWWVCCVAGIAAAAANQQADLSPGVLA